MAAIEHRAHQEINEHLCLRAASRLGMRVARSEVMQFGDERAIVLERYDRMTRPDGSVLRVHQEDICQPRAAYPASRYEREDGGPGAVEVVDTLRQHLPPSAARAAIETFFRALAFSWVIYGPDAHAKNYSLLLSGAAVRPAPLYDISPVVPYPDRYDLRTMAINGKYENRLVTGEDWRALASKVGADPDQVIGWVYDVVSNAPDALASVVAEQAQWITTLDMSRQLIDGVAANSTALLRWIEPPGTAPGTAPAPRRPGKPRVAGYRKADGTWVSGYENPRYRG